MGALKRCHLRWHHAATPCRISGGSTRICTTGFTHLCSIGVKSLLEYVLMPGEKHDVLPLSRGVIVGLLG
jgi:hypothetical protein